MKKIIIGSVVMLIGIVIYSCYYDNEEQLYPELSTNCDTTNVTYKATIAPLMANSCTGCHGANAASFGGNIDLRTYDNVKTNIGRILGCVQQLSGYSPMPKGGSKLSDCKINQLKKWNSDGATNN